MKKFSFSQIHKKGKIDSHAGESINTLYHSKDNEADFNSPWFAPLFEIIIAIHHQQCILPNMHLSNFIYSSGQTTLLDTSTVLENQSAQQCLENLALFFTQFYGKHLLHLDKWLNDYHQIIFPDVPFNQFKRRYFAAETKQFKKALLNTETNGHEFSVISTGQYSGMSTKEHSSIIQTLLTQGIDSIVNNGTALKRCTSATISIVELFNKRYVVKRYNNKNVIVFLKRQFKTSRAKISWQGAHWLEILGVTTPKPIAYIETRRKGVVREAYFVTEFIEGSDLKTLLNQRQGQQRTHDTAEVLFQQIKLLFSLMKRFKFSHGDMKASNLMVTNNALCVIDLDAMALFLSSSRQEKNYLKDKNRFLKNWTNNKELLDLTGQLGIDSR